MVAYVPPAPSEPNSNRKSSAEYSLIFPSIGGGGYVPARILRLVLLHTQEDISVSIPILIFVYSSFLKTPGSPNIPIQAIGLSLYEKLVSEDGPEEEPGTKVTRTQWLDFSSLKKTDLIGKNILIVDEVDDTRTTLQYAVQELSKDVETQAKKLGTNEKTNFYIFVLHVCFHPYLERGIANRRGSLEVNLKGDLEQG